MHLTHPRRYACILLILALVLCTTVTTKPVSRVFADGPYLVRLPLVTKSVASHALPTPQPGTPPEQLALDRINAYRALAGVPPLEPHPTLLAAAQHHADYDLRNHSDASAWTDGPHGEVSGKPAFSGVMPGDRAVAPLPDRSWIRAQRQSGDLLLEQAQRTAEHDAPPPEDQVQRALMWLDKYCGRFATPAREVLQARKLLRDTSSRAHE